MAEEKQPFIRFVTDLHKTKPSDVIQIFDRKTFYSVYGTDALFIANEYFKTLATVNYLGADKLATQTIQPGQLENILIDLLENKQFKFEIWAQSGSNWERVKKGSPGNVNGLEELFTTFTDLEGLDSGTIAVTVSTSAGNHLVGIALCDAGQRIIRVAEFLDNIHFTNLESILVQAPGVKECLLYFDKKNPECKAISDVLKRCSIVLTEVPQRDFNSKDVEQDLTRLLGKITHILPQLELKSAMEALGCVIKYLEIMADETNFGQFKLKQLDLSQYMHLDSAAIEALKIVASKRDVNKQMNLYSLLNKCRTQMGSRRLMTWIRQPLLNVNAIEERLNLVEVFYHDNSLRLDLRDRFLKGTPDFSRVIKRLQRNTAKLEDCVKLYYFLRQLPELTELFQNYTGPFDEVIKERYTSTLESLVDDFSKFTTMIETTIDLAAADNHEYYIKPDFDADLKDLHAKKSQIHAQISKHSDAIHSKLGHIKTFTTQNFAQFGYCFRVSRKDEKQLRDSKLKYVTVDTRKDGVKFKTPELKTMSEEYEQLKQECESKQSELVSSMMKIVASYEPAFLEISELITEIDVFCSLAQVFSSSPKSYVRPKITPMGEGDIVLKDARHPCLELQELIHYVPNDVSFIRGKSTFQIITGPNMGGKSTYIRSVGIIVLMAQVGCFVPCSSATITVVDAILCRVGAGDSQSRGVSTFMAEMLETTSILETATENSLVIVDELGRGTSTYDGFGLAWAISEHICKEIKAFCFFATHFHELTALANEIPGVTNLHVSAVTKDNQLVLLYSVRPGPCDQSFGIHVAEMANFPEEVIKLAKRKAAELENFDTAPNAKRMAGTSLCNF